MSPSIGSDYKMPKPSANNGTMPNANHPIFSSDNCTFPSETGAPFFYQNGLTTGVRPSNGLHGQGMPDYHQPHFSRCSVFDLPSCRFQRTGVQPVVTEPPYYGIQLNGGRMYVNRHNFATEPLTQQNIVQFPVNELSNFPPRAPTLSIQQRGSQLHTPMVESQNNDSTVHRTSQNALQSVEPSQFPNASSLPQDAGRKRNDAGKRKRTVFSSYQNDCLEKVFEENNYIQRDTVERLSKELHLTEKQVKIWFQNRRMRKKKQKAGSSSSTSVASSADSPPFSPEISYSMDCILSHPPSLIARLSGLQV